MNVSEILTQLDILKSENKDLQNKCVNLEKANCFLTKNLEEEIDDSVSIKAELDATIAKHNNSIQIEQNLKNQGNEKKQLQAKHEKTCMEVKTLKTEIEDLKKEIDKLGVVTKTIKKEAKENDSRNKNTIKKHEEALGELNRYKILKSSEEKNLKTKQKKVIKKLKNVGELEAKLKLEIKELANGLGKLDSNDNETNQEFEDEILPDPTHNTTNDLSTSEQAAVSTEEGFATFTDSVDEEIEDIMTKAEISIRERARKLVERKLEVKLKDIEISKEALIELEQELLKDLEETIQEQILAYRNFQFNDYQVHDEDFKEDSQEIPPFYWGGEVCCEVMFLDENFQS